MFVISFCINVYFKVTINVDSEVNKEKRHAHTITPSDTKSKVLGSRTCLVTQQSNQNLHILFKPIGPETIPMYPDLSWFWGFSVRQNRTWNTNKKMKTLVYVTWKCI